MKKQVLVLITLVGLSTNVFGQKQTVTTKKVTAVTKQGDVIKAAELKTNGKTVRAAKIVPAQKISAKKKAVALTLKKRADSLKDRIAKLEATVKKLEQQHKQILDDHGKIASKIESKKTVATKKSK